MRLVNTDDWADNGEIKQVIKDLSNEERWELFEDCRRPQWAEENSVSFPFLLEVEVSGF